MTEEIFVPLLEEGSTAYRPVPALKIAENVYQVLGSDIYNPDDEVWAFTPGQTVEVKIKELSGFSVDGETREAQKVAVRLRAVP